MIEQIETDEQGNIISRRTVTSAVRVRCEICQEVIATIDRNTIEAPINGSMFLSPDPVHGFPAPFDPSLDWETMRCPICQHRPFLAEDPEVCVIVLLENNQHIEVRPKALIEPIDFVRETEKIQPIVEYEKRLEETKDEVQPLSLIPSENNELVDNSDKKKYTRKTEEEKSNQKGKKRTRRKRKGLEGMKR